MATGGKGRDGRQQRDRTRAYRARQELHDRVTRRRTRDNVVAIAVGLVVILGAIGIQTAYFVSGPGAPVPETSPSPTAPVTPELDESIVPDPTPAPTASETPTP